MLEVVVVLGANRELVGADVVLPKREPAWPEVVDGANLIGVVVGFQVWSAGLAAGFSGASASASASASTLSSTRTG